MSKTRARKKQSPIVAYGDAVGPLGFRMKSAVASVVESMLAKQSREMRDAFASGCDQGRDVQRARGCVARATRAEMAAVVDAVQTKGARGVGHRQ